MSLGRIDLSLREARLVWGLLGQPRSRSASRSFGSGSNLPSFQVTFGWSKIGQPQNGTLVTGDDQNLWSISWWIHFDPYPSRGLDPWFELWVREGSQEATPPPQISAQRSAFVLGRRSKAPVSDRDQV